MRIPIIVAARPSLDFNSPRVYLRAGKWTFDSDRKETEFYILHNDVLHDGAGELVMDKSGEVKLKFKHVGNESSITVYACLTL